MPKPQPPITYKIFGTLGLWAIFRNDQHIATFEAQSLAERLVWEMIEESCKEGRASQVLVQKELVCEKLLCRCFEGPAPGTPLN
jgi:hypothetical protein